MDHTVLVFAKNVRGVDTDANYECFVFHLALERYASCFYAFSGACKGGHGFSTVILGQSQGLCSLCRNGVAAICASIKDVHLLSTGQCIEIPMSHQKFHKSHQKFHNFMSMDFLSRETLCGSRQVQANMCTILQGNIANGKQVYRLPRCNRWCLLLS